MIDPEIELENVDFQMEERFVRFPLPHLSDEGVEIWSKAAETPVGQLGARSLDAELLCGIAKLSILESYLLQ